MKRKALTIWQELSEVCKLVETRPSTADITTNKRIGSRLSKLLDLIPNPSGSIIEAEARALLAELNSDWEKALFYRKQEADLIKELQASISENQRESGIERVILSRRNKEELEVKLKWIDELKVKLRLQKRDSPSTG